MATSNVAGIVVSFAAAFCWGLVYAQVQTLDNSISPWAVLAMFYLLSAAMLLPFTAWRLPTLAKKAYVNRKDFIICLIFLLSAEMLIFYSIDVLGGTDASLIEVSTKYLEVSGTWISLELTTRKVSYPLWTALVLFLTIGERPTKATMIGGSLIMAGVFVIIIARVKQQKA